MYTNSSAQSNYVGKHWGPMLDTSLASTATVNHMDLLCVIFCHAFLKSTCELKVNKFVRFEVYNLFMATTGRDVHH